MDTIPKIRLAIRLDAKSIYAVDCPAELFVADF